MPVFSMQLSFSGGFARSPGRVLRRGIRTARRRKAPCAKSAARP
jgi:hypothetical protein